MSNKMDLSQFKNLPKEEAKMYVAAAKKDKAALEAQKAKGGPTWTESKQDELTEVTMFLVDAEDLLENWPDNSKYQVPVGSEKCVHLKIFKGTNRYDSRTGKELRKPYVQMFSYAEWQLFKNNHKALGFSIIEVLHDPYNEASAFVDPDMAN